MANSAFIGSKACRQCHPGEYAAFQGSGHSRTLARAGETEVAGKIDGHVYDDPENPGVKWRYTRDGKQLIAERQEGEKHLRAILDYALGSGNHAMTFVSLSKDGKIPPSGEEHRMSYFAHSDTVSLTPGHIRKMNEPGKTPTGLHLPPAGVLDCIECHGTQTVPPIKKGLTPETMIPNVSCERCHGPGRAHVEAATRLAASGGDGSDLPSLAMPFNGEEDGTKQVAMCGHCHRLPSMIPTDWIRTDNATLARFPSVGLSFSACYTKSAGTLSCTTCHEPHGRTSTDTAAYEAICLSCHTAQEEKGKPASLEPTASTTNKPCPVNPRNGCVECHMPLRKPSEAGLRFTDHWIRKPDPPAGQ
ncbi:MAG: hypothetical protein ABS79_02795 [Planctomycetes bacterium SCN 63-9]|nr:MAG: hypothetical protein ABS79_02795 [Planctomycetes bacterium SCN 63-9]